jgi:hypothetical protein
VTAQIGGLARPRPGGTVSLTHRRQREEIEMDDDVLEYDVEEAARIVSERTGMEVDLVEGVLEAEFLFQAALGSFEIPDDEEGQSFMAEVSRVRQEHGDLLPPIDADLDEFPDLDDRLVTFVTRLTGADPAAIEDILDEHILYLEEVGVLEPEEDQD